MVEIPGFRLRKAGGSRTDQANGQRGLALATFQPYSFGEPTNIVRSCYVLVKDELSRCPPNSAEGKRTGRGNARGSRQETDGCCGRKCDTPELPEGGAFGLGLKWLKSDAWSLRQGSARGGQQTLVLHGTR